jgi:hypothetical protein
MFIFFLGLILGGCIGFIVTHVQMHIVEQISDRDSEIARLKAELKKTLDV